MCLTECDSFHCTVVGDNERNIFVIGLQGFMGITSTENSVFTEESKYLRILGTVLSLYCLVAIAWSLQPLPLSSGVV